MIKISIAEAQKQIQNYCENCGNCAAAEVGTKGTNISSIRIAEMLKGFPILTGKMVYDSS